MTNDDAKAESQPQDQLVLPGSPRDGYALRPHQKTRFRAAGTTIYRDKRSDYEPHRIGVDVVAVATDPAEAETLAEALQRFYDRRAVSCLGCRTHFFEQRYRLGAEDDAERALLSGWIREEHGFRCPACRTFPRPATSATLPEEGRRVLHDVLEAYGPIGLLHVGRDALEQLFRLLPRRKGTEMALDEWLQRGFEHIVERVSERTVEHVEGTKKRKP